jgi:bifunctional DNA-binding transcriptional regulator/antitoxin component of YhaV-PrlF toxin-antitoxin module
MLAKMTSKNQITLPKKIADQFPGVRYFEIAKEGDRIVLHPVRPGLASEVRERLESLGVSEQDVADAVNWARRRD